MAEADDEDEQLFVVDLVDDAIFADAGAPAWTVMIPSELHNAMWPRIDLESVERPDDPPLALGAELRELAPGRGREDDLKPPITHATFSGLETEFAFDLLERTRRAVVQLSESVVSEAIVVVVFRALQKLHLFERNDGGDPPTAACDDDAFAPIRDSINEVGE